MQLLSWPKNENKAIHAKQCVKMTVIYYSIRIYVVNIRRVIFSCKFLIILFFHIYLSYRTE